MIVTSFAPAKVNLYLHVGRPRADGMHPLDSLVAFAADVGDWVSAGPAGDLSLEISGPFADALAEEADNLVLRAARALAEAADVPAYASIHLEKTLPIASGIGGGSADAAATLRVLNRLWRVGASDADLERLAAGLGADVPVCVQSRVRRMRGVGDMLEDPPAPLPPLFALLVNPRTPSPTGQVYRTFDSMGLGDAPLAPAGRTTDGLAWLATLRNDLEAPSAAVTPAIAAALAKVRQSGASFARVSGSGSTCFALFEEPDAAVPVAEALRDTGWWVKPTALADVDVAPTGG